MTLRIPESVAFEVLDGEAVLLSLTASRYYRLNPTATTVWRAVASGATVDEAIAVICSRYDTDSMTASRDVERLVQRLLDARLLEESP